MTTPFAEKLAGLLSQPAHNLPKCFVIYALVIIEGGD